MTATASIRTEDLGEVRAGGGSRRQGYYFRLVLAAGLALTLVAGAHGGSDGGLGKMKRIAEIPLQYRIFSTPVIWRGHDGESFNIVLVTGEEGPSREKITAIDAYAGNGRRARGFPLMRHSPYVVAPGSQIAAADTDADGTAELVAMTLDGSLLTVRPGGGSAQHSPSRNATHGMLAWPPVPVVTAAGKPPVFVLISRDFQPRTDGRDAVDIIDINGRSMSGFPVMLPTNPEPRRPVVDLRSGRLFALLQTGEVEAFELRGGARPKGFPSAAIESVPPAGVRRMVMFGNVLIVSVGTAHLTRIDPATGAVSKLTVAETQKITGIEAAGDRLFAIDEGTRRLLSLDAQGKVRAAVSLNLQPGTRNYWIEAVPMRAAGNYAVFIVSSLDPDPDVRIGVVFEQHATLQDKQELKQRAEKLAQRKYKTLRLDQKQQKEMDHSIAMMQLSYLRNTLGPERTSTLVGGESETRIQAVIDANGQMQLAMDETVKRYTPDTGFSFAETAYPALSSDPSGSSVLFAVPLNYAEPADDPRDENRSLLRIYRAPL